MKNIIKIIKINAKIHHDNNNKKQLEHNNHTRHTNININIIHFLSNNLLISELFFFISYSIFFVIFENYYETGLFLFDVDDEVEAPSFNGVPNFVVMYV